MPGPRVGAGEAVAPGGPVRRRPPRHRALHEVVSVVWSHVVPHDASVLRVLPDAAVDLVFAGGRLTVAGPDTTARLERLPAGAVVLGLQLHPGAVPAVLGAPASVVRDERVDLSDVWGAPAAAAANAMQACVTTEEAATVLEECLVDRLGAAAPPDPLAAVLRHHLRPGASALRPVDDFGVGERQLRRRCTAAYGYGPKVLARVLRFQTVVRRMRAAPETPLARLAADLGYADQSHLSHDVGALSGMTPGALRSVLRVSDIDTTRS